eukprot:4002137-Ditylum_brightwellii.AAC.1
MQLGQVWGAVTQQPDSNGPLQCPRGNQTSSTTNQNENQQQDGKLLCSCLNAHQLKQIMGHAVALVEGGDNVEGTGNRLRQGFQE